MRKGIAGFVFSTAMVFSAGTVRAEESIEDIFRQLGGEPVAPVKEAPATPAPAKSTEDIFRQLGGEPVKPAAPAPAAVVEQAVPEEPVVAVKEEELPALVEEAAVPAETAIAVAEEKAPRREKAEKPVDPLVAKLEQARRFYLNEELDKAEIQLGLILQESPYHVEAMQYLRRVHDRKQVRAAKQAEASRAEMMTTVQQAWNPPLKAAAMESMDVEEVRDADEETTRIEALRNKMASIIIPNLDFRDANIKDVVRFLSEVCLRLDPAKKGVNMILLGLDAPQQVAARDDGFGATASAAGSRDISITIQLRDIPLLEALRYITDMSGLKYEIMPNVVQISPVNYVSDQKLVLRTFDIIPAVGAELSAAAGETPAAGRAAPGGGFDLFGGGGRTESASTAPSGTVDVSAFFSGVDFPQGASASYRPKFNKLTVRNTAPNIQIIKELVDEMTNAVRRQRSQQVEIEAKFVEVNEGAFSELGFDWSVANRWWVTDENLNGTGGGQQNVFGRTTANRQELNRALGSASGQLGTLLRDAAVASQLKMARLDGSIPFQVVINALERSGGADLLSAPRVVTKSGHEATIKIVEVRRFPMDFDVEEISVTLSGTGGGAASLPPLAYVEPTDYEDKEIGYLLVVKPDVDPDSNTIDLELAPQIIEYLGEDDPRMVYNAGAGTQLFVSMPIFRTRTVNTQVTVADGSTVVLGGLMNEGIVRYKDQIPVLGNLPLIGRFFRSESERSEKKNLMIFVTATQVDAYGYKTNERAQVMELAK